MLRLTYKNLISFSKIVHRAKFPAKTEFFKPANIHTTPHWFSKTDKLNSKNINALQLKYKTG